MPLIFGKPSYQGFKVPEVKRSLYFMVLYYLIAFMLRLEVKRTKDKADKFNTKYNKQLQKEIIEILIDNF